MADALTWGIWKPLTEHRCEPPKTEPWDELPDHWECPECGQLHHRLTPPCGEHFDVDDQGQCAAYREDVANR